MPELKTFTQISLDDFIYWKTPEKYGAAMPRKIQYDPKDRNRIVFELDNASSVSLPRTHTEHIAADIIYTTDENTYFKWSVPTKEKELAEKIKERDLLNFDITELEKKLAKIKSLNGN